MTRFTADLDFKNKFKLSYYITKALILIPNITFLSLTPSHSKGYHLIIFTKNKFTLKQQYLIRASIGDDPTRIKMDKKRKFGRNTLFDRKEFIK